MNLYFRDSLHILTAMYTNMDHAYFQIKLCRRGAIKYFCLDFLLSCYELAFEMNMFIMQWLILLFALKLNLTENMVISKGKGLFESPS